MLLTWSFAMLQTPSESCRYRRAVGDRCRPSWSSCARAVGRNLCAPDGGHFGMGGKPTRALPPHIFCRNIFGEAVGDGWSRPPSNLSTRGRAVVTTEADRGAVIVKLIELHAEALADRYHHLGEQCASIRIEQSVERAPDPVVAHVLHLLGTDAEHPAGEPMYRLLLAVDRFSLDDNGA